MVWSFFKFFLLANIFTCLIYIAAQRQPYCIYAGNTDFVRAGSEYVDVFQLSWNTLATVGYGAVGPMPPTEFYRW